MTTTKDDTDGEWLDELIFLKLGLDLTRRDTQYPLIPASDLAAFRVGVLNHITSLLAAERQAIKAAIPSRYKPNPGFNSIHDMDEGFNEAIDQFHKIIEERDI